jgi:tryptophan-rich sensory protein
MNLRRIVEIVWLAVAAFAAVEGYISYKEEGFGNNTFLMFAVFGMAMVMYFVRKRQRRKLNK